MGKYDRLLIPKPKMAAYDPEVPVPGHLLP